MSAASIPMAQVAGHESLEEESHRRLQASLEWFTIGIAFCPLQQFQNKNWTIPTSKMEELTAQSSKLAEWGFFSLPTLHLEIHQLGVELNISSRSEKC